MLTFFAGLPRSQLLRLRLLCSEDSDFLEKGGEMVSFFEQHGYSPACLQNDLQAIRQLDRAGVLNNHNPSNQRSERIPLILTYHPLNERIKRILLRNFNILSSDPETRAVFPQPPLVAYRRDSNLRNILPPHPFFKGKALGTRLLRDKKKQKTFQIRRSC